MIKQTIEFVETKIPCLDPITRFGGKPTWFSTPQWPLSRSTGQPMQFICQILLTPPVFTHSSSEKMAYLFMSASDDEYIDGTYDSEQGENAFFIQTKAMDIPADAEVEGILLSKRIDLPNSAPIFEPCEFIAKLTTGAESESQPQALHGMGIEPFENKIGGWPVFLQDNEFPAGGEWKLALQLSDSRVPFSVNFGDGCGYAFIDESAQLGKFFWQCY